MTTNHTIQRGDTWQRTFTLSQGGSPVDFADVAAARMTFRKRAVKGSESATILDDSSATVNITIGDGITVVDEPNGEVAVVLTPVRTRLLISNQYAWDFQVTLNDGRVFTVDAGRATILDEVTVST